MVVTRLKANIVHVVTPTHSKKYSSLAMEPMDLHTTNANSAVRRVAVNSFLGTDMPNSLLLAHSNFYASILARRCKNGF